MNVKRVIRDPLFFLSLTVETLRKLSKNTCLVSDIGMRWFFSEVALWSEETHGGMESSRVNSATVGVVSEGKVLRGQASSSSFIT